MQQKFRSNIPMFQHASHLADQSKLRNEVQSYQTGSKALVPINPGQCVLYDKNFDSNPNKDQNGLKE